MRQTEFFKIYLSVKTFFDVDLGYFKESYFYNPDLSLFRMVLRKIQLHTTKSQELIDITSKITDVQQQNKVDEGYCIVFTLHTTAGVTINEGVDPDVCKDIIRTIGQLIPEHNSYRPAEGNSDAHIKASLFGSSELILVENNQLVLGIWQHVFFYIGDGPRNRTV